MKIGTKSLLFGVHNIIWHPLTVLIAWFKLYGRPDFKTLICIIIHDWGYWGCPNMDGPEGQKHPEYAAVKVGLWRWGPEYYNLCLLHSRHLAKQIGTTPSRLCWADKLSICYDPMWFYLLRARLSGELREYRAENEISGFFPESGTNREWLKKLRAFMKDQAERQESSTLYMTSEVSGTSIDHVWLDELAFKPNGAYTIGIDMVGKDSTDYSAIAIRCKECGNIIESRILRPREEYRLEINHTCPTHKELNIEVSGTEKDSIDHIR